MNFFLKFLIRQSFLRRRKGSKRNIPLSAYVIAKEYYLLKRQAGRELRNLTLILIGVVAAAFGLKSFLLANKFIDGGVTGISLLLTELTGIALPILILVINIPFVVLGYHQVNRNFAIKTMIGVAALAFCVAVIHFPVVTSDKLLVAVFGGFFLGMGIGLAIRGGGVLDGTEVLSLYLSKKTGLTLGDVLLMVNVVIFSVAAVLLSVESALYSILTYFAASKTITFVIEGIEEYIGVTIISIRSDEVRLMIIETMGRGVTVYSGKRGFGKRGEQLNDIDIIFTVITRLELAKLKSEIDRIDSSAFVVMGSIKDTQGGMIKKRPLVH
jgi:uncharacterized membrane-anchored protein YitT (DUF2179 family)